MATQQTTSNIDQLLQELSPVLYRVALCIDQETDQLAFATSSLSELAQVLTGEFRVKGRMSDYVGARIAVELMEHMAAVHGKISHGRDS